MSEIVRILTALLALFMQLLSQLQGGFRPTPTPTSLAATATPTAIIAPSNTATPVLPTATRTLTLTPTRTPTRTPTPTATLFDLADQTDPTGFRVIGEPPAQRLPTAVLIYPLISANGGEETLIEMLNVTNATVNVKCHYINTTRCSGIDFFVRLTAQQPLAWTASTGRDGNGVRIAPPLSGEAEMKCFVQPGGFASLSAHNALHGRAIVSNTSGETIGYSAIGFRRLTAGGFSSEVQLDGVTYEQCPDRLHFQALASQAGSDSEIILVPCEEDLLRLAPASSAIQFAVINEFEQQFSGSISLQCYSRSRFSTIPALRRSSVGTDTVHAIVRSVHVPVVGMVIDRFTIPGSGEMSVSANTPFLEGGRSATITIPDFGF